MTVEKHAINFHQHRELSDREVTTMDSAVQPLQVGEGSGLVGKLACAADQIELFASPSARREPWASVDVELDACGFTDELLQPR